MLQLLSASLEQSKGLPAVLKNVKLPVKPALLCFLSFTVELKWRSYVYVYYCKLKNNMASTPLKQAWKEQKWDNLKLHWELIRKVWHCSHTASSCLLLCVTDTQWRHESDNSNYRLLSSAKLRLQGTWTNILLVWRGQMVFSLLNNMCHQFGKIATIFLMPLTQLHKFSKWCFFHNTFPVKTLLFRITVALRVGIVSMFLQHVSAAWVRGYWQTDGEGE